MKNTMKLNTLLFAVMAAFFCTIFSATIISQAYADEVITNDNAGASELKNKFFGKKWKMKKIGGDGNISHVIIGNDGGYVMNNKFGETFKRGEFIFVSGKNGVFIVEWTSRYQEDDYPDLASGIRGSKGFKEMLLYVDRHKFRFVIPGNSKKATASHVNGGLGKYLFEIAEE